MSKITVLPTFLLVFLVAPLGSVYAQKPTKYITIVNSTNTQPEQELTRRIQKNTSELLRGNYKVRYNIKNGQNNSLRVKRIIKQLQSDKKTQVIVATGLVASQQLAKLKRYKKPSIASLIVDESLQGMPRALQGKSGVPNFTYIKQPTNVASDLLQFNKITPINQFSVIVDDLFLSQRQAIQAWLQSKTNKPFELVFVNRGNFVQKLDGLPTSVDGLYVLPLPTFNRNELGQFFDKVTKKQLPSFAMQGRSYTDAGALASYVSSDYAEIKARRIALDVLKITEGTPVSRLPVYLPRLDKDFVLNMATANSIGVSPDFALMKQVDVIHQTDTSSTATTIGFEQALKLALANNLELKKIQQDIAMSQTEISEAKRAFLPSLDLVYQATKVDKDFRMVQGAGITQKLKASATQVLYSDQAIALYKARKLGIESNLKALKRAEYELIFNVLSGYVQNLNAKSQLTLQQDNTRKTRKNLEVAKRKAAVGYAGKMDVYRLQSELSINQANLNKARANYQQAQLSLKKLLDLPLDEPVNFTDIQHPIELLSYGNPDLSNKLNNAKQLGLFSDYLSDIAKQRRPAILQYQYQIESLQKVAKAEKRRWYMPLVSVAANASKTLKRHDIVPEVGERVLSPNWDVSLTASLPLFDRQQKTNDQKNAIKIDKLKVEKADLIKSINLSIKNDIQTALASYSQIALYKESAASAMKSFELINNLYKHGQASISNLIEAQNNVLNAKLSVIQAEQQFFIDFLKVEKNTGFYYFIASENEKNDFVEGFSQFIKQKKTLESEKTVN